MTEQDDYEKKLVYFRSLLQELDEISRRIESGEALTGDNNDIKETALEYARKSREWFSPDFNDIRQGKGGERAGDDVEFSAEQFKLFEEALKQTEENDWSKLRDILLRTARSFKKAWPNDPDAVKAVRHIRAFAKAVDELKKSGLT